MVPLFILAVFLAQKSKNVRTAGKLLDTGTFLLDGHLLRYLGLWAEIDDLDDGRLAVPRAESNIDGLADVGVLVGLVHVDEWIVCVLSQDRRVDYVLVFESLQGLVSHMRC